MAIWPTQFKPLVNSIEESPPNNLLRSQPDKGPAKQRRRTTANVRPIAFRMLLRNADVEVFDDFFVDSTYSGAETFDWVHPRTGVLCSARFTQPPNYREQGATHFMVEVSLEIMP